MSEFESKLDSWSFSSYAPNRRIDEAHAERIVRTERESKFEFLRKIGQGAFGVVWLVQERSTQRFCALKILLLPVESEAVKNFRRCGLETTMLLPIEAPDDAGGVWSYVMPIADDLRSRQIEPSSYEPKTLEAFVDCKGRVGAEAARTLALELLKTIAKLHDAGFAHCDLKPDNIVMLNGEWKIADVGLLTQHNKQLPESPFQLRSSNDDPKLRDILAVAGCLFVALTGVSQGKAVAEFKRFLGSEKTHSEIEDFRPMLKMVYAGKISDARTFSNALEQQPERTKPKYTRLKMVVAVALLCAGAQFARSRGPSSSEIESLYFEIARDLEDPDIIPGESIHRISLVENRKKAFVDYANFAFRPLGADDHFRFRGGFRSPEFWFMLEIDAAGAVAIIAMSNGRESGVTSDRDSMGRPAFRSFNESPAGGNIIILATSTELQHEAALKSQLKNVGAPPKFAIRERASRSTVTDEQHSVRDFVSKLENSFGPEIKIHAWLHLRNGPQTSTSASHPKAEMLPSSTG